MVRKKSIYIHEKKQEARKNLIPGGINIGISKENIWEREARRLKYGKKKSLTWENFEDIRLRGHIHIWVGYASDLSRQLSMITSKLEILKQSLDVPHRQGLKTGMHALWWGLNLIMPEVFFIILWWRNVGSESKDT